MPTRVTEGGHDVAPADDTLVQKRHEVRMIVVDDVLQKRKHLVYWRRLRQRQKARLARDRARHGAQGIEMRPDERIDSGVMAPRVPDGREAPG